MFFDRFANWSLKMKLHVIIAVLSFFLHQGIAKADDITDAKMVAVALKKNPTKESYKEFVEEKLKPAVPVLEKKLSGEKDEKKAEKMIDSLKKLETAAGIEVETVADRSFKINGLITIKSLIQNWSGKDIIFGVAGRSVRIDRDEIQKAKDSSSNLGSQAYIVWSKIEEKLKNDHKIVFR